MSIYDLAFEQAERELGERIGYPALVYAPKQPRQSRYCIEPSRAGWDIMDETTPLRDTDIVDRLNEQDDDLTRARAELTALTKAANLAYDAIDFQLSCWSNDEDGPPPHDLLNAHTALYGLLRYARDPEDDGVDLPF
jgi:hypothetical protein